MSHMCLLDSQILRVCYRCFCKCFTFTIFFTMFALTLFCASASFEITSLFFNLLPSFSIWVLVVNSCYFFFSPPTAFALSSSTPPSHQNRVLPFSFPHPFLYARCSLVFHTSNTPTTISATHPHVSHLLFLSSSPSFTDYQSSSVAVVTHSPPGNRNRY